MVDEKRISRRAFLKLATCAAGVAAMVPQVSVLERLIPAAGAEAELGRGSAAILDSFGTLRVSQELLDDAGFMSPYRLLRDVGMDPPAIFMPEEFSTDFRAWAAAEGIEYVEGEETLHGYPIMWTEKVHE